MDTMSGTSVGTSWPSRLLLLLFSLHHVFFGWLAIGGVGAATGGAPLALGASLPFAVYGVWRCLTCRVVVGPDTVVVRNRWRTYRVRRADITGMRPGGLQLMKPSPRLLVLDVAQGRPVKMQATVAPTREGRRRAVRLLAGSGVTGHRMHEYVDAPIA